MNCSVLFLLMYIKELKAEKQIMRSVTGKRLCSRHVFTALPPSLACPQCCSQIWQQYNSVLQRQRHPELQPGVCGKTCRGLNQHIWCLFLPTHHMGIVILIQTEHHIRLKRLSLKNHLSCGSLISYSVHHLRECHTIIHLEKRLKQTSHDC